MNAPVSHVLIMERVLTSLTDMSATATMGLLDSTVKQVICETL